MILEYRQKIKNHRIFFQNKLILVLKIFIIFLNKSFNNPKNVSHLNYSKTKNSLTKIQLNIVKSKKV